MLEKTITVELLDLAGTEDFTAMRDLYIKNGDGFILMYSVTSLRDFNGLVDMRELSLSVCDSYVLPFVLVGTYKKGGKEPREVTREQGQEMADRFGCPFFEVDVSECEQVDVILKPLLPKAILRREEKKKQKKEKDRDCVVM